MHNQLQQPAAVPSAKSTLRNLRVRGELPMLDRSGHHRCTTAKGVRRQPCPGAHCSGPDGIQGIATDLLLGDGETSSPPSRDRAPRTAGLVAKTMDLRTAARRVG
jgi:hypothetical protein